MLIRKCTSKLDKTQITTVRSNELNTKNYSHPFNSRRLPTFATKIEKNRPICFFKTKRKLHRECEVNPKPSKCANFLAFVLL